MDTRHTAATGPPVSDAFALLFSDIVEEFVNFVFCIAVTTKFVDTEEQECTLGMDLLTCFRHA